MKPFELKVYKVFILNRVCASKRVSFSTNHPIKFREWAVDTFSGDFEIDTWDELVIPKFIACQRIMAENPDAIEFKLRMDVDNIADMVIFKLAWG